MKDNRINAVIAITTVVGALLMIIALSFAIGKWNFGKHGYELHIQFPNATGINANSQVKYAGAPAGRVRQIKLIPRKDQTPDPHTKLFNCVEVVIEVNNEIEIGKDVSATIKQDGFGISAKYILLTPGPDHDSPALVDGDTVQGEMPFDLSDLLQPAGEALEQAKALVTELQPMITELQPVLGRVDTLTDKMNTDLPPLMGHADKFLQDGDSVLSNLNSPESKDRINDMLANLSVATANLKVVSSNAKALTATLAEKPWRVFWGGSTVKPPDESAVMKSDTVIPLPGETTSKAQNPPAAQKKTNSSQLN